MRWNQRLGWGWRPRLVVLLFAALSVGGFLLLSLVRKVPEPSDLFQVGLYLAFAVHGWGVVGVVQVIAAEMEAGTIELLLLTRIRPRDLVLGQYLIGMLSSLVAVLGLVPWLWLGWLNSGMEGIAMLWIFGVWVAAGLALNSVYLAMASFGRTLSGGGMAAVGVGYLLVTSYVVVGRLMEAGSSAGLMASSMVSLKFFGVVSVCGVSAASWRLARALRTSGRVVSKRWRWWMGSPRRPGAVARARLLDANPIEWLASAGSPWWAWAVLVVGVLFSWEHGVREAFEAMGWVRGGLLILLSFQAYGQLRYDLKEGTWEALLRTPVTVRQYVMGHVRAWWRQQSWLLAAVAVAPGLAGIAEVWSHGSGAPWRDSAGVVLSGVLLTGADTLLASIWFLGSAVKYDGGSFLFAAALSAGILSLMQVLHVVGGMGFWWPWIWVGIAVLIFLISFEVVCREIADQLEAAAGAERRKPPGWVWES